MKTKLQLAFAIIIGSFALHCTQSSMTGGGGGGGDGGVGDARGDTGTCCTVTPQTFTKIAEGDIALSYNTAFATPTFDVSQYREVVIGFTDSASACNPVNISLMFQEPSSSAFIFTGQATGRIRVDGPTAELTGYGSCQQTTSTGTAHYVVTGVGLN